MKLIFSRKGFDTGSGGCPSPILPDGSMFSLPIPDDRSPVRYGDLTWNGHNVGEVVERLTRGKVKAGDGAHLDPDLRPGQVPRDAGWRPLLGQVAAAQGHLRNQGAGVGDTFIFWGLFRRVDANWRWDGPPLHVIWGWLRVAEVVAVDAVRGLPAWTWAAQHPHFAFDQPDASNTLYAAADATGAGVFERFDASRQLTAACAESPTIWSLPGCFMPADGKPALSYHSAAHRWTRDGDRVRLQTVSRGQEFVLDCEQYPEAPSWLVQRTGVIP